MNTFNGTSDFFQIPSSVFLQLTNFTISLWFKTSKNYTPATNGGEGMMLTKGGWISNEVGKQLSYGLWVSDANHLRGGFETTQGQDNILTTSGTKFNDDKWHHGAITYDGKKLSLYAEGKVFKEMNTIAPPEKNNIPLVIGKNPLPYRTGYFKGQLAKIKLYNRGLTAQEISNVYTDQNVDLIFSIL